MVEKSTTYWAVCLLILFIVIVVIEFVITGGFVTLGARIITQWLNDTFGDYSIYVQGVLSVLVIILLILILHLARKKGWF